MHNPTACWSGFYDVGICHTAAQRWSARSSPLGARDGARTARQHGAVPRTPPRSKEHFVMSMAGSAMTEAAPGGTTTAPCATGADGADSASILTLPPGPAGRLAPPLTLGATARQVPLSATLAA